MDLTLTTSSSRLERGESGEVFISLTNNTEFLVEQIRVTPTLSSAFLFSQSSRMESLTAGASGGLDLTITAKDRASLGSHSFAVRAEYELVTAEERIKSQTTATASLEIAQSPGPSVELLVSVNPDSQEHGKDVDLFVSIRNNSDREIWDITITLDNSSFAVRVPNAPVELAAEATPNGIALSEPLAPSATARRVLIITPLDGAAFKEHTLQIRASYKWSRLLNGGETPSTEVATEEATTTTLTVKRQFEDELAAAEPSAIAFFFALPVLSAFLGYYIITQLVAEKEKRGLSSIAWKATPVFGLASILLHYLAAEVLDVDYTGDLPQENQLLKLVLLWSGAGAALALVVHQGRWGIDAGWRSVRAAANRIVRLARGVAQAVTRWRMEGKWTNLNEAQYVEKAGPRRRPMVKVTSGGATYSGLLLETSGDIAVLGAQVDVHFPDEKDDDRYTSTFDIEDKMLKAKEVRILIEQGKLTTTNATRIMREGRPLPQFAVVLEGALESSGPSTEAVVSKV